MSTLEQTIAEVVRDAVREGLETQPLERCQFTVPEVAEMMGCGRPLVEKLVETGELWAIREGPRLLRIPKVAIDEYIERHRP